MLNRNVRMYSMLLAVCLVFVTACGGEDDELSISSVCEDACGRLMDLCDDITDADECRSECAGELAGTTESQRILARDCIENAPNCAAAVACSEVIHADGDMDDITIEVVAVSYYMGETSATGYLAFFSDNASASAAADSGVGCAVAVHAIPLSGDGQLKGSKSITLPEGTYHVIGFADLNGDGCLNEGERVHEFIKAYKFEAWMATDTEEARKVKLLGDYDGTETMCLDFEQCGSTPDGDTDTVDDVDVVDDVDDTDTTDQDTTPSNTGQATMTADGTTLTFEGENFMGACWSENTPQAGWISCSWIKDNDQIVVGVPYDIAGPTTYTEADYPLSFKLWIDLNSVRYAPADGSSMNFNLSTWTDTEGGGSFSGDFVEQYGDATLNVSQASFTGLK